MAFTSPKSLPREWAEAATAVRKWTYKLTLQGRPASELMVEVAEPQPSERVLDVASGSGDPAVAFSRSVGPTGRVTATDATPELLGIGQERANRLGLRNVGFQEASMEQLPFDDSSFDIVTCRFGIMYSRDVEQTLSEIRRVLKIDGRVVMMVWGAFENNPYFAIPIKVLLKHTLILESGPEAPNPFAYAKKGKLSNELEQAGFRFVKEESRVVPWPWVGSVVNYWESFQELAMPIRRVIDELSIEQKKVAEKEIGEKASVYFDGGQVNFPAQINLVSGTK